MQETAADDGSCKINVLGLRVGYRVLWRVLELEGKRNRIFRRFVDKIDQNFVQEF